MAQTVTLSSFMTKTDPPTVPPRDRERGVPRGCGARGDPLRRGRCGTAAARPSSPRGSPVRGAVCAHPGSEPAAPPPTGGPRRPRGREGHTRGGAPGERGSRQRSRPTEGGRPGPALPRGRRGRGSLCRLLLQPRERTGGAGGSRRSGSTAPALTQPPPSPGDAARRPAAAAAAAAAPGGDGAPRGPAAQVPRDPPRPRSAAPPSARLLTPPPPRRSGARPRVRGVRGHLRCARAAPAGVLLPVTAAGEGAERGVFPGNGPVPEQPHVT